MKDTFSKLIGVPACNKTSEPVKPVQFKKAPWDTTDTELPMVNEPEKPEQLLKAYVPSSVTEFGMVNEPIKPLHSAKALPPIEFNALPRDKPVNPLQ
jgi:hypothetical protein